VDESGVIPSRHDHHHHGGPCSHITRGRLGGVVVSVLATGPKGCGFETGQGDGLLRAIKSTAHLPLGWEVKPEGPTS
jgi:hypothetical protein